MFSIVLFFYRRLPTFVFIVRFLILFYMGVFESLINNKINVLRKTDATDFN